MRLIKKNFFKMKYLLFIFTGFKSLTDRREAFLINRLLYFTHVRVHLRLRQDRAGGAVLQEVEVAAQQILLLHVATVVLHLLHRLLCVQQTLVGLLSGSMLG